MNRILLSGFFIFASHAAAADWLACAAIESDQQRLACYDEQATSLAVKAEVEPQATEVQLAKNLFNAKSAAAAKSTTEVSIVAAKQDNRKRWVFTLASGEKWRQQDALPLGRLKQFPIKAKIIISRFKRSLLQIEGEHRKIEIKQLSP